MSISHKGLVPHNKGKTNVELYGEERAKEIFEKSSKSLSGINSPNYGRRHSEETKKKMSESSKGKNLGKKASEETREKLRKLRGGKTYREIYGEEKAKEVSEHLSKAHKELWGNEEFTRERAKSMLLTPNKMELKLCILLDIWFPNKFKYVGDFMLFVGRNCPDFVSTGDEKLIIELFGEPWHKKEEEISRPKIFKKHGYETLIIWSKELKDEEVLKQKVTDFISDNAIQNNIIIKSEVIYK